MYFFTKFFLQLVRMNNRFIYGISIFFIFASAFAAYLLEPETFLTPFNGLWWVMTTVTTVGYGDFYPKTIPGKCLGIFVFIFGIGLISITISKIVDGLFMYQRKKEEGKLRYTGKQHFVIIDWSKHAEHAIQEIRNTDPTAKIVLIDMLEKSPCNLDHVHYIQGNPVHPNTLEMANLAEARAVFIFADEVTQYQNLIRDPSFIDGKTLLVATTIERYYNHVHTVVEIKDKANLPCFEHIQVNEFIFGSETISQLAVRSAFSPGTSNILAQLLTHQHGEDLFEVPKQPHWTTYRDAFQDLLQQGATLISDGTKLNINTRLDDKIADHARLFVICSKDTYQQIRGRSLNFR